MNKNIKAWIRALKSGKYKQTQNKLKRENSYCCLGVACDLYLKSKDNKDKMTWKDINHFTSLPIPVRNWLRLKKGNPVVKIISKKVLNKIKERKIDLITMNDTLKCNFKIIAKHLENQYK